MNQHELIEPDGIYYEDIYPEQSNNTSSKMNKNSCMDSCSNCIASMAFLCYWLCGNN